MRGIEPRFARRSVPTTLHRKIVERKTPKNDNPRKYGYLISCELSVESPSPKSTKKKNYEGILVQILLFQQLVKTLRI